MPDGRIVVANGGIQTDPEDRTPLNLDRMRPNLSMISPTGSILSQREFGADLHRNSIRHLAVLPDVIAFAMQWQGDPSEAVPLLGLASADRPLTACPPPEDARDAMRGYAGSIAAHGDGLIAVTSPRGGVAMIFDATGAWRATLRRADLCGVAAADDAPFTLTDGGGAIWAADAGGLRLRAKHPVAWDNHLVALRA